MREGLKVVLSSQEMTQMISNEALASIIFNRFYNLLELVNYYNGLQTVRNRMIVTLFIFHFYDIKNFEPDGLSNETTKGNYFRESGYFERWQFVAGVKN